MGSLPESTVQAYAQAKIQGEVFRDVVVVLNVGLKDLVVDVIFRLRAGLGKARDISHQHIREGVARGNRDLAVEYQIAAQICVCHLIFLGVHKIAAELQLVLAETFGDVVAKGERGIRILPGESGWAFTEAAAVCRYGLHTKTGELSSEVWKQSGHGEIATTRPYRRIGVDLPDVVGGIAGHKFIEKGRRNCCRESANHFHAGPYEMGSDGRKAFSS